jgi:hypothetical protein
VNTQPYNKPTLGGTIPFAASSQQPLGVACNGMDWNRYFVYNPDTGSLVWRKRPRSDFKSNRSHTFFNNKYAGQEAGWKDRKKNGKPSRIRVEVDGVTTSVHAIAWALMIGPIQDGIMPDHIDRNPYNNRWSNLRAATPSENSRNQAVRRNNKSGFTGVYFNKKAQKWMANIRVDDNLMHLGTFDCIGLAAVARAKASIRYFKQFSPILKHNVGTQGAHLAQGQTE